MTKDERTASDSARPATGEAPTGQGPPVLASLNAGSLGVAIGFAVAAAVMFTPFFAPPFLVLLGRSLFLAMVLLLAFVGVQRLPERFLPFGMPRWLATVLAVGIAAPLGTFVVYLLSVGGSVSAFVGNPARMTGFFIIAGTALVLGLVITLTAQLREREARARSQALEFELERSRLEKQAVDARLALLQAQVEPHFLFNTLANVQALVESNSPRAAPVLASLIAYLRAAMPRLHEGEPVLATELALVRAYLELMQMRMPDRLRFEIAVDPALERLRFPPMALLTLVENAVRHGIDPAEDGGRIEVGGVREAGADRLWVADSGVGMAATAEPGTGLANLRARLAGFYGPGAELRLTEQSASPPHGLRAELVLPR
ncbi:MAG: histidine kinase [Rubrivivax sp.]|nr:histidine kinase [Rubrivivax sp.]